MGGENLPGEDLNLYVPTPLPEKPFQSIQKRRGGVRGGKTSRPIKDRGALFLIGKKKGEKKTFTTATRKKGN